MSRRTVNHYQEPSLDTQREALMSEQFRNAVIELLPGFPPPAEAWQPSDRIPSVHELLDKGQEFRERVGAADNVPPGVLICLIGNEVTEAVLGNYTRELERTFPETIANADHPFHKFGRYWAAEEQRHGTILDRYLGFSRRINLRKVEETIMHLNRAGFNTRSGDSIYQGIIYPRVQEHLTALAHINVGSKCQDPYLQEICKLITQDETRHKGAYHSLVSALMTLDPAGTTAAIGNIVRKGIMMPAELMNTKDEPDLYGKFSRVAALEDVLGPEHMLKVHNGMMGPGKYGLDIAEQKYNGEFAEGAEEARIWLLERYPRVIRIGADKYSSPAKISHPDFSWLNN